MSRNTSIHFKDDTTGNGFKIAAYILLVNIEKERDSTASL